jgi:hypothetical protein
MLADKKPASDDNPRRRLVNFFAEEDADGTLHFGGSVPRSNSEGTHQNSGPDEMPFNRRWQYLSPLTVRVVRLLCKKGWLSHEEIAAELKDAPTSKLGPLLTDMAERGILESSTKKGYHIGVPEDAAGDAFCRDLLAWLARDYPEPTNPG